MSKIIGLDAGHGMGTLGKRCLKSLDPNQTREWWLNDRIMDIVEQTLKEYYDCNVLRVDDTTGAKDISLSARVKAANNAKADIYVSMHHNAGINGGSGGGTVVFYYSGKSARLTQARQLYNDIVGETKLTGNRANPVVKKEYYVLKNTNMPAFLVENGFMDSRADTPIILTQEHANKTAKGVVKFIVELFNLKAVKAQPSATQQATGAYYKAYTGKKTTLAAALKSIGVNSTYAYRKQIAKANGIVGYIGTARQNTRMYNLLVAGLLKKV